MSKIFLLGECMIELSTLSPNTLKKSYAGDVFNTAVYLKRVFPQTQVHLITAVGQDQHSKEMVEYFKCENIDTACVFISQDKIPGLYAIHTDKSGERSFNYWRNDSAARQVIKYLNEDIIDKIAQGDVLFFSGISLGILPHEDRELFWAFIEILRNANVKIVFDPNYRVNMWQSTEDTRSQYALAFQYANIILPGVEDFKQLYNLNSVEQIADYCQQFLFDKVLIKNEDKKLLLIEDNQRQNIEIEPVNKVIDTTSAGDSFNGAYLGAWLNNLPTKDSILLASKVAGYVIQHKGAIVEKKAFQAFLKNLNTQ